MAKMRSVVLLLAAALVVMASQPGTAQAQVDQHAIAQQIIGLDVRERNNAFDAALRIGPANSSQELRSALIALLEKENRVSAEARSRRVAVETIENPEFIAHVAAFVAELKEPRAIPALAAAFESGSTALMPALAAFGEQAAPNVLSVVSSQQSSHEELNGGLITLRLMVEGMGTNPLTSGTVDQIRRAAQFRLTGQQYFTTLLYGIDLAVSLKDDDLRKIVDLLASKQTEVVARGVTDSALIKLVQKRAVDRLAAAPGRKP